MKLFKCLSESSMEAIRALRHDLAVQRQERRVRAVKRRDRRTVHAT